MQLRSLEMIPFETLFDAFRRAFVDYSVPIALTRTQLAEIHRRRGVRLDLSAGAFAGDALVGFTFNGLGEWEGRRSGYDSGTGVCPDARGRRLASRMMYRSLELLRDVGATRYVLEVIQDNAVAYRVYEGLGFRVTRELLCWSLDSVAESTNAEIGIELVSSLDSVKPGGMWDWTPTWQNSIDSIRRAAELRSILAAVESDAVVGYAVLFESGDLAQFAVAPSSRRCGIGTALLHAARARSTHPLRIINTDSRDAGTSSFLEALGATETVRQYEMILDF